jgi:DNA-binding CsgD family transcriptional regulator
VIALAELSLLAMYQRDESRGLAASEEAERLGRAAGDAWSLAYALSARAMQEASRPDHRAAAELAQASLEIWANLELGEQDDRSMLARNCLAIAALALGDVDGAERRAAEFLDHVRRDGDDAGVSIAFHRLGLVALVRNDSVAALRAFLAAIDLHARIGSGWMVAYTLDGLAAAAGVHADDERTARLLSAAAQMRRSAGVTLFGPLAHAHEQAVTKVRTSLGEAAYERAQTAGQALAIKDIVAEATTFVETLGRDKSTESAPAPARSNVYGLTEREIEVLGLVVTGLTAPRIADQLYVSPRTIHTHLAAIYRKLDVSTRGEAVRVAVEQGLA